MHLFVLRQGFTIWPLLAWSSVSRTGWPWTPRDPCASALQLLGLTGHPTVFVMPNISVLVWEALLERNCTVFFLNLNFSHRYFTFHLVQERLLRSTIQCADFVKQHLDGLAVVPLCQFSCCDKIPWPKWLKGHGLAHSLRIQALWEVMAAGACSSRHTTPQLGSQVQWALVQAGFLLFLWFCLGPQPRGRVLSTCRVNFPALFKLIKIIKLN